MDDPLLKYATQFQCDEFMAVVRENEAALSHSQWDELQSTLSSLPSYETLRERGDEVVMRAGDSVCIGEASQLRADEHKQLDRLIRLLAPWRKGPFTLFGQEIDSEWRSNLKWDRIAPALPELAHKKVCDVGCGNGYYLYRLAEHNPKLIVGLDPSERFTLTARALQHFAAHPTISYQMAGSDELRFFSQFFDVILCFGVLYHQRSPLDLLVGLRNALRPGGVALVETLVMPGEDPMAFCPPERYAKMRNIYFLPTVPAFKDWLLKSGFIDLEVVSIATTTVREQRQTALAPFESLADFLSPDQQTTIEGYPLPLRATLRAVRKPQ